jgi:uncharacterized protein YciW
VAGGTGLTPAERAENAAQSLHSAKLEGHSVTAATKVDTAEYVAGTIDAQELQRRVRARYGVLTADEVELRLVEIEKSAELAGHRLMLMPRTGLDASWPG